MACCAPEPWNLVQQSCERFGTHSGRMPLCHGRRMLRAHISAFVCLAVVTAVTGAGAIQTFPAFVWGSGDYIAKSAGNHGIQASYEVLQPLSYLKTRRTPDLV